MTEKQQMTAPIIRLEIESMKHGIMTALTAYAAQMDTDIRHAVEAYCTSANLQAVIRQAAQDAIDKVVKDEFRNFFVYGEGRKFVAEQVKKQLGIEGDSDQ